MKIIKIHVWKAESFGKILPERWIIDVYDETGECVKFSSETKPEVVTEK